MTFEESMREYERWINPSLINGFLESTYTKDGSIRFFSKNRATWETKCNNISFFNASTDLAIKESKWKHNYINSDVIFDEQPIYICNSHNEYTENETDNADIDMYLNNYKIKE